MGIRYQIVEKRSHTKLIQIRQYSCEEIMKPNMKIATTPLALDTPTIVNKLDQWLESDKCVEMFESYQRTGDVTELTRPEPEQTISTNYCNSNTLQGSTVTVLNPSTFVRLVPALPGDTQQAPTDTDSIPVVVREVVEEQRLPLPVVQTNRKRTMITRSLSRQVSEVKQEDDNDDDWLPENHAPPTKKSRRSGAGRKPNSAKGDGLDHLPADERDKVRLRRQKNKEAAARCRQKRVDITNTLAKQVEEHQAAKRLLEQEIKQLRQEQANLLRVLENHKACGCNLLGGGSNNNGHVAAPQQQLQLQEENLRVAEVKPFTVAIKSQPVIVEAANAPYILSDPITEQHQPLTKPQRPQTLFGLACSKPTNMSDKSLIKEEELETPSKSLFFEMPTIFGGLNTPTCSVQSLTANKEDLTTPNNDGLFSTSLTAL